jgi:hypothetical protein
VALNWGLSSLNRRLTCEITNVFLSLRWRAAYLPEGRRGLLAMHASATARPRMAGQKEMTLVEAVKYRTVVNTGELNNWTDYHPSTQSGLRQTPDRGPVSRGRLLVGDLTGYQAFFEGAAPEHYP